MGILGLLLLVGGFGAWATFSRIAGAVVAPGQVEVEQHRSGRVRPVTRRHQALPVSLSGPPSQPARMWMWV